MRNKKIKLFKPYMSWQSIWNVIKVLRSDQIAEGPQVKAFEADFEEWFGFEKGQVLAVNSGTSALELAYELAHIGPGDEVISPVFTCTATNLPLVRRGAKIVFADITEDLNIDIEDVKRKITDKTKAIVFVHFGGNNRGLRELLEVCKERGIALIEDGAQVLGSDFWGLGNFTAISLQAIKTVTAGDGGFLICRSPEDYAKAKRLRWFGYDRDEKQAKGDTDLVEAGYKYHMNDIMAAIGRGNLKQFKKIIEHRERIATIYKSYGLFAHTWLAGGFAKFGEYERLKIMYAVKGIEMGQHHYRNDKYSVFGGNRYINGAVQCINNTLPNMNQLEYRYFFVPFHMGVTEKMAHEIGQIYSNYQKHG